MVREKTPKSFSSGLYSSRHADKFVIRLKDGMREAINDAAKDANCSMNSWIIHRLERILINEHPLAWTPTTNMPVYYNDLVYLIQNFEIDKDGELIAELVRRDSEGELVEVKALVTELSQYKIV